jgi:hypothetical protein
MEERLIQKIARHQIGVIAKDPYSGKIGLNYNGYMVLRRYKRGQTHVSISNISEMGKSKKKQVVEQFEKWLKEERYLFERKAQHNVDYLCTLNTKPPIHILIQKDRIDRVDLGMDIRIVDDKGVSIFSHMDKRKLKRILESAQIELLQFPIICNFRPSIENIETVQIRDFIYFDALTKDRFFSCIHQLIRVFALISGKIGPLVSKSKLNNST